MKSLGFFLFGLASLFLLRGEVWSQVAVYTNLSNEMVEKNLQGLELKFEKGEIKRKKADIAYFDFKRGEIAYRVYNYRSDLWIESVFDKKMTLEELNLWNASAKFSRAVLLDDKGKISISLESQLDCNGGVTDAMIKQFVNRFDEEAKKFVKAAAK